MGSREEKAAAVAHATLSYQEACQEVIALRRALQMAPNSLNIARVLRNSVLEQRHLYRVLVKADKDFDSYQEGDILILQEGDDEQGES